MVKAVKGILGRRCGEMILQHGDRGQAGLLAAAQGIGRFRKRAPDDAEMRAFGECLLDQLSNGQI